MSFNRFGVMRDISNVFRDLAINSQNIGGSFTFTGTAAIPSRPDITVYASPDGEDFKVKWGDLSLKLSDYTKLEEEVKSLRSQVAKLTKLLSVSKVMDDFPQIEVNETSQREEVL